MPLAYPAEPILAAPGIGKFGKDPRPQGEPAGCRQLERGGTPGSRASGSPVHDTAPFRLSAAGRAEGAGGRPAQLVDGYGAVEGEEDSVSNPQLGLGACHGRS